MCGGGIQARRATTATTTTTTIPPVKTMTRKQVQEESHPDKHCLIIIQDAVYNCTKWMDSHPGGRLTIRALSGKDATDAFLVNHPEFVYTDLVQKKKHFHAKLDESDTKQTELTRHYRELTKKMEDAGLFDTNYTYYYFLLARIFSMLAIAIYGCLYSNSLLVHAGCGALLGMFWQQIAFVGHDIGHNGITHDRITDSRLGLVLANLLTGLSGAWWKLNHNVHHVITNSIEHDPDIQHMPFFAVHNDFVTKGIYSTFYKCQQPLNNVAHCMIRVQHYLYFPVMGFARFYLYVNSLLHGLGLGPYSTKEKVYRRDLQVLTLFGFWTWYLCLVMSLPTWTSRVVFFLLAHNVAGILHVQITLSHFGMPAYSGSPYETADNEFIRTQLEGSLDVTCPPYMDWFHGGLQFQAVHHLWPRMPRRNLRRAQVLLIAFCQEHDIPYCRVGFVEAVKMTIDRLKETAKSAKSFHHAFYDSIRMNG